MSVGKCPKCNSTSTVYSQGSARCNQCGFTKVGSKAFFPDASRSYPSSSIPPSSTFEVVKEVFIKEAVVKEAVIHPTTPLVPTTPPTQTPTPVPPHVPTAPPAVSVTPAVKRETLA